MTSSPPAMTDEQLAEIEAREELNRLNGWHIDAEIMRDLLSDLRRCQARMAAVEAVTSEDGLPPSGSVDYDAGWDDAISTIRAALAAGGGEGNE